MTVLLPIAPARPAAAAPGCGLRLGTLMTIATLVIPLLTVGCNQPRPIVVQPLPQAPELTDAQRRDGMLKVADTARDAGEFANAAELYRKIIAEGMDTVAIRLSLADCLMASGDIAGATDQYKVAEARAPTDPRPEIGLGRLNLVNHQPMIAVSAYTLALQLDPTNLVALNGKGVALDLLQRHSEAQQVYREGLAISPSDRMLRNNLGLSLVFSKNYPEAVAVLTALAEEPQATPRNRQNLALALGIEGDKTDAEMVAAHDLDNASVANNLHYYDFIRSGGEVPPLQAQGPAPVTP